MPTPIFTFPKLLLQWCNFKIALNLEFTSVYTVVHVKDSGEIIWVVGLGKPGIFFIDFFLFRRLKKIFNYDLWILQARDDVMVQLLFMCQGLIHVVLGWSHCSWVGHFVGAIFTQTDTHTHTHTRILQPVDWVVLGADSIKTRREFWSKGILKILRKRMTQGLIQLVQGVCRTSPATPGLLIMF